MQALLSQQQERTRRALEQLQEAALGLDTDEELDDFPRDADPEAPPRPLHAETPHALLYNQPSYERAQLERRRPNRPRRQPTLSRQEIQQGILQTDEVLGHRLADATLDQTASILHQFLAFASAQKEVEFQTMELDMQIAFWIEWKRQGGQLHRSSPAMYAKKMGLVYFKAFRRRSEVLRDYQQAMNRMPENQPMGARPLTPEELEALLRAAPNDEIYFHILLMWGTASRADDMLSIRPMDVEVVRLPPDERHYAWVTWRQGTKARAHEQADALALSPEQAEDLQDFLDSRPLGSPLFTLTADQLTDRLREALETLDPRVSSHSVKKGALTHLLSQGYDASMVSHKAKHTDLKLLRSYVPSRAWAVAHGVMRMASDLVTRVMPPSATGPSTQTE